MSLPSLRLPFGDLAGGLEHAVALATLAHATTYPTELRRFEPTDPAWLDLGYPVAADEREQQLTLVLQALLADAVCTIEELRQEGFPERVLRGLSGSPSSA